jgi:SAM-dependent methyltransferase
VHSLLCWQAYDSKTTWLWKEKQSTFGSKSMNTQALKQSIRSFMAAEGFLFDTPPKKVEKKLAVRMGAESYKNFCNVADAMRASEVGISELYRCVENLSDAHLLFSHQSDVSADIYAAIAAALLQLRPTPSSILDCGCGTGIFTRWLAQTFQDARIVGTDREKHFIQMASQRPSKAKYEVWSYGDALADDERFDALVSCLGIDLPHIDDPQLENDQSWRTSEHYRERLVYLTPVLRSWRARVEDGATLITAFRISGPAEFLPLVDAATTAGWKLCTESFDRILVGEWEHMPLCIFDAGESHMMSELNVLFLWGGSEDAELEPSYD